MSSLQQIEEKGRPVSSWKRGGWGEREGMEGRGRNDPNNVCTYECVNTEKRLI
jgi:hypothetical protein